MKEQTRAAAKTAWQEERFLDAGRSIYESLSVDQRVIWAVQVLGHCADHAPHCDAVSAVLSLARSKDRWCLAHAAFCTLRQVTLEAERSPSRFDRRLRSLLYLAENTAKVIYNASGAPAPFDEDSGWWIGECLHHFLSTQDDRSVRTEALAFFFLS